MDQMIMLRLGLKYYKNKECEGHERKGNLWEGTGGSPCTNSNLSYLHNYIFRVLHNNFYEILGLLSCLYVIGPFPSIAFPL